MRARKGGRKQTSPWRLSFNLSSRLPEKPKGRPAEKDRNKGGEAKKKITTFNPCRARLQQKGNEPSNEKSQGGRGEKKGEGVREKNRFFDANRSRESRHPQLRGPIIGLRPKTSSDDPLLTFSSGSAAQFTVRPEGHRIDEEEAEKDPEAAADHI